MIPSPAIILLVMVRSPTGAWTIGAHRSDQAQLSDNPSLYARRQKVIHSIAYNSLTGKPLV